MITYMYIAIHGSICMQVWKFMRTYVDTGRTDCLSLQLDKVPGLNRSLISKVHETLDDKSFGIKNDY